MVLARHHLVVSGNPTVAFFLVLDEFLAQKLEKIGVRTGAFKGREGVGFVDAHNLFTACFETVLVELLHVYIFALLIIDMLCLMEALTFQPNALLLKTLHLRYHSVHFDSLHSV